MTNYKPKPYDPNTPVACPTSLEDLARDHPGPGRPVSDGLIAPPDESSQPWGGYSPTRSFATPHAGPGRPVIRPGLTEGGGGPAFSLERFAAQLRSRLQGNCTGWAFVINQNGQEAAADAGGRAITSTDTDGSNTLIGTQNMTPDTRVNVASVSKTITAVAVLRLLRQIGLGTLDDIWPYLPDEWPLGPNVEQLRFHGLLAHRSGLTSTNTNFNQTLPDQGLRTAIQTGANPGATYNYLNANFALFRVIIPTLWRQAGLAGANNDNPVASAFFYAVYIIEELFSLMGGAIGANASTSPLDSQPARYYQNAASSLGVSYPNWALWAGGGGWHLTARELAAFLAHITYNDQVLAPDLRAGMDSLRYGWRPANVTTGQFGAYWGHGGSINWLANGRTGSVRTAIMKFNIQVEASLVVNSQLTSTSGDSARQLLIDAYDAAWA